jgi:hypothetical protein
MARVLLALFGSDLGQAAFQHRDHFVPAGVGLLVVQHCLEALP